LKNAALTDKMPATADQPKRSAEAVRMTRLSWEALRELARTRAPDEMEHRDVILMRGSLNVSIPYGKPLPQAVYDSTSAVQRVLANAFPNFAIAGEESENQMNAEFKHVRYIGNITGRDESGKLSTFIEMRCSELNIPVNPHVSLTCAFPLGEYKPQSEAAIKGVLTQILGLDFIPFGPEEIPKEKQGNHCILLVLDGKPVATGEHAVTEAGLNINLGKIALRSGAMPLV
jgi:hypothetical protein